MWCFPNLFVTIHGIKTLLWCICFSLFNVLFAFAWDIFLWSLIVVDEKQTLRAFWRRYYNVASASFSAAFFRVHDRFPKISFKHVVNCIASAIFVAKIVLDIMAWRKIEGLDLWARTFQTPDFITSFLATPYPPVVITSNIGPSIIDLGGMVNISFQMTSSIGIESVSLHFKSPNGQQQECGQLHIDPTSPYHATSSTLCKMQLSHHTPGEYAVTAVARDYACNTFSASLGAVTLAPQRQTLAPPQFFSRHLPHHSHLRIPDDLNQTHPQDSCDEHSPRNVSLGRSTEFSTLSIHKQLHSLPPHAPFHKILTRSASSAQSVSLCRFTAATNPQAVFVPTSPSDHTCWSTSFTGIYYTHVLLQLTVYYLFLPLLFLGKSHAIYEELCKTTSTLVTNHKKMRRCVHCLVDDLKPGDSCVVNCPNGHPIHRRCLDHLIAQQVACPAERVHTHRPFNLVVAQHPVIPTSCLDVRCPECRFSNPSPVTSYMTSLYTPNNLCCDGGGAGGAGAWWLLNGDSVLARVSIEFSAAKWRGQLCSPVLCPAGSVQSFKSVSNRSQIVGSMHLAVVLSTRLSCSQAQGCIQTRTQKKIRRMVLTRIGSAQVSKTHEGLYQQGMQLMLDKKCEIAAKVFASGVTLGSTRCMAELSWMLCNGRLGVVKNGDRAFRLASLGVRENCSDCMAALSKCLADGSGCEQNFALSIELAQQSASAGSRLGQYQLGVLNYDSLSHISHKYSRLQNPSMSIHSAIHNLNLAAAHNMPSAVCKLGHLREKGCAVFPADHAEAVKLYRAAAAHGHPPAYFRLAICYERGHGVAADPRLAIEMYLKAHEAGFDTESVRYHLNLLGAVLPLPLCKTHAVVAALCTAVLVAAKPIAWLLSKCVLGTKATARMKLCVSVAALIPFCHTLLHHDYQLVAEVRAVPRLLMMLPWLLAACTIVRHKIQLILGPWRCRPLHSLLQACHDGAREFVWPSCLLFRLGSFVCGFVWKKMYERGHYAWIEPPFDILIFATVLLNQCFVCCATHYVYRCLLGSI
jgi:TPR repeat protein